MMREQQRRKWREDNREAINAYNRRINESCVYGEGLRSF
jgi:antitoxin CcdA